MDASTLGLQLEARIAAAFVTIDDDDMYGEVLTAVLEGLHSRHGVFAYLDEHDRIIAPSLTRDVWEECHMPDRRLVFEHVRGGEGVEDRALDTCRTQVKNEVGSVLEGHVAIERVMVTPIVYGATAIGYLAVANKDVDYDDDDAAVLERVAAFVAPVLQARLGREREEARRRAAEGALRRAHRLLEAKVVERTSALQQANLALRSEVEERRRAEQVAREAVQRSRAALAGTVAAMGSMVEHRDAFTAAHQRRVAALCAVMSDAYRLQPTARDVLHLAALVHDVGKIGVPAEVLAKPGRLSDVEFDLVREHVGIGHDILTGIAFEGDVAGIVLQHHERLDGSGYPQGLGERDIVTEARLLAVADVVEAMASHRPHRSALGVEAALQELREGAGRLYDPNVVQICVAAFESGFELPS